MSVKDGDGASGGVQDSASSGDTSWTGGLRFRGPISGQLFSKKFASTSRFVVSSKVWQNTIPTRDCDVLMTFPAKTEDHVLMWLLARLRARTPQLVVHVRHHSNTGVYGFYLTATYEKLLKMAEDMAIKKLLKSEFGGGMKEFVFDEQDCYEGVDDPSSFFTSQERQSIVHNVLNNLRAGENDQLDKVSFIEGQAIVPILLSKGVISQVLPLHNSEDMTFLRKNWVQAFFRRQPLEKICEYFGVKIAMYFAYLGHYTKALMLPAFFGLFLSTMLGRSQETDDICFVVFAGFNVLWATLYLEHWKRTSAELAYGWGTLDKEDELLVEPRALYKGDLVKSPVMNRLEPYYPSWKRNLFRYFVSVPVMCVCLLVVFIVMLCIFELQEWINSKIEKQEAPNICKFFPKILLAVSIGVLDDIYKKIAYWLNEKENYRLDETYENHLIIKLILFQFVNSFLSLFYIAFYLKDMNRLREQLAALLITRQVIGNIKEALVPYVVDKIKLYRLGYEMTSHMSNEALDQQMRQMTGGADEATTKCRSDQGQADQASSQVQELMTEISQCKERDAVDHKDTGGKIESETTKRYGGPVLTQAEVEGSMKRYEDTFEDYLEMFIQFGYVTLFSSAFPMAAMCGLLNNVIEVRSDAFKLCMTFQRPFGQRVRDIGVWQDALELMSVIAIIVNCALIGMSGQVHRMLPNMGVTETLVMIVVLEHLILVLKLGIAYAIPDIPQWVAEEKARLEYLRRAAFKKLEAQSNPNTPKTPLSRATSEEKENAATAKLAEAPSGGDSKKFSDQEKTSCKSSTDDSQGDGDAAATNVEIKQPQ